MMAGRPPPYPDQFAHEMDQDVNSIMTEYDKGLCIIFPIFSIPLLI